MGGISSPVLNESLHERVRAFYEGGFHADDVYKSELGWFHADDVYRSELGWFHSLGLRLAYEF